jgi:hypothetical protein
LRKIKFHWKFWVKAWNLRICRIVYDLKYCNFKILIKSSFYLKLSSIENRNTLRKSSIKCQIFCMKNSSHFQALSTRSTPKRKPHTLSHPNLKTIDKQNCKKFRICIQFQQCKSFHHISESLNCIYNCSRCKIDVNGTKRFLMCELLFFRKMKWGFYRWVNFWNSNRFDSENSFEKALIFQASALLSFPIHLSMPPFFPSETPQKLKAISRKKTHKKIW